MSTEEKKPAKATPAKDPLEKIAPILEKIEKRSQLIRFITKDELATLRKHCYGTKEQIAKRAAKKAEQAALRKAKIAEAEAEVAKMKAEG